MGIASSLLGGIAGGAVVTVVITAIDNVSPVLGGINKNMLALSAGLIAFGAAGTIALAGTVKGASDLAEETSKLLTIFDEIDKSELEQTIKDLGESYILSNREATGLVASTGDLLTGIGLTDEAALKFAVDVVSLGSDLASFNNFQGGAAGAARILEKALLGEREGLKSLGISILEADVKQQLLKDGTSELTGTALKEARAQATLTLIYEQSANAIGDVARTKDDYANKVRALKKDLVNLSDEIGTVLLPVAAKVIDVISKVVKWFSDLSDGQKKAIVIIAGVSFVLAILTGVLIGVSLAVLAVTAAASPWLLLIGLIILLIGGLIIAGVLLVKNWDKVKIAASNLGIFIENVFKGIANAVLWVWNGIVEVIEFSINSILKQFEPLIKAFNFITGKNLSSSIDLGGAKADLFEFENFKSFDTPESTKDTSGTTIYVGQVNGMTGKDIARELEEEFGNTIYL